MASKKKSTTEDVLKVLCDSVQSILSKATKTKITYSPMIQKISKTCLKPDIGCFVMFEGGFSGLVVLNFPAESALEIYSNYMLSMGLTKSELAISHTSDEVADTLGELMNQAIADFRNELQKEYVISVNQSQPKMLVLTNELMISINTQIEKPQCRKVLFDTKKFRPFYLEMAIEKIEFIPLFDYEKGKSADTDQILEDERKKILGELG